MENLKKMKECLVSKVEAQIYGNLDQVNAEELGAAIDMIKDLSEAVYYCTITESMEGQEEEEGKKKKHQNGGMMYYSRPMPIYDTIYPIEYYDPRYRARYNDGTMYASNGSSGGSNSSSSNSGSNSGGNNARGGGTRGYSDGNYTMYNDGMMYHESGMYPQYPMPYYRDGMMHDPQEGRSGKRRKMYMEGKAHKDKAKQMQELEAYMQELAQDMAEMVQDASPEEKQLLQSKINTLAQKIK